MAKQAIQSLLAQRRALFPWKEHEPLEDWAEDIEDGREGPGRIERISLELCCTDETPEAQANGAEPAPAAYRERICIDRAAGVLEQEQTMGEARVLHTYHVPAALTATACRPFINGWRRRSCGF